MRTPILLMILLFGRLLVAADNGGSELDQFRVFIQEHPRALDELKRDPSLIGRAEFVKEHKVVGDYLSKHPGIPKEVKAVPHFFDNLTATTKGGAHRPHPEGKQK